MCARPTIGRALRRGLIPALGILGDPPDTGQSHVLRARQVRWAGAWGGPRGPPVPGSLTPTETSKPKHSAHLMGSGDPLSPTLGRTRRAPGQTTPERGCPAPGWHKKAQRVQLSRPHLIPAHLAGRRHALSAGPPGLRPSQAPALEAGILVSSPSSPRSFTLGGPPRFCQWGPKGMSYTPERKPLSEGSASI